MHLVSALCGKLLGISLSLEDDTESSRDALFPEVFPCTFEFLSQTLQNSITHHDGEIAFLCQETLHAFMFKALNDSSCTRSFASWMATCWTLITKLVSTSPWSSLQQQSLWILRDWTSSLTPQRLGTLGLDVSFTIYF
jgi:hypothetical protein